MSETETDSWHRERASNYLRDNPGEWPRLFGTKFWVLWSLAIMFYDLPPAPYRFDDVALQANATSFQLAHVVHVIYFLPLLVLGIIDIGLFVPWSRHPGPMLAVMIAITVTVVIFHPSPGYRSPADSFVLVLAFYTLKQIWSWLAPRLSERSRCEKYRSGVNPT